MSARFVVPTLAAALLLPAGASAATTNVTRAGGTLTITSDTSGGAGTFRLSDVGGTVAWSDPSGKSTSSDGSCTVAGSGDTAGLTCGAAPLDHIVVVLSGSQGARVEVDAAANTIAFTGTDGDDTLDSSQTSAAVTATLGAGTDSASTGSGNDIVHGGPGDDTFDPGAGDDTIYGDAGNDTFNAGQRDDGDDTFDGGVDGPAGPELRWGNRDGDTVSYGLRDQSSTSVTVVLPPDNVNVPQDGNGGPGEHDRLAHVENAIGQPGYFAYSGSHHPPPYPDPADVNYLTGNERSNDLVGGLQADTLSGAGGDDNIVTRDPAAYFGPAVSTVDCGDGDDTVRRNVGDRATNCEHDEPGIAAVVIHPGPLQVGQTMSATATVFGDIATRVDEWERCDAAIGPWVCSSVGTGDQHAVTAADVGHILVFRVTVSSSSPASSDQLDTPVGSVPPPAAPFVPLAIRSSGAAKSALGSPVVLTTRLGLGTGTAVFEPTMVESTHRLRLATRSTKLLAIACEAACSGTVSGSLRLTLSRGGHRTVKLRTQRISIAAGAVGVVRVPTTSSVRRAIRNARVATLTVRATLTSAGTTRRGHTTFKVAT